MKHFIRPLGPAGTKTHTVMTLGGGLQQKSCKDLGRNGPIGDWGIRHISVCEEKSRVSGAQLVCGILTVLVHDVSFTRLHNSRRWILS